MGRNERMVLMKKFRNKQKGQSLIEFALLALFVGVPIFVLFLGGVILFWDRIWADRSAANAAYAAATYVVDGRGSCYEKAMAAFGDPPYWGVKKGVEPLKSVSNCPSDPNQLPARGAPIIAKVVLTEDLPLPGFDGHPFPLPVEVSDRYSR